MHNTMLRNPHSGDRRPQSLLLSAPVIAAGGMCPGGCIVDYFKAVLNDPRHDVLFVGYQAQGTPGRAIQTYGPGNGYVELDEVRYKIGAKVSKIGGYSARGNQQRLMGFVTQMAE